MEVLGIVVGVLLILAALVITAVVLGQSSKNARHSGVIAGSAETFFGKSKGGERDRKLNRLTLVVAIVFVALVLVMYIVQPDRAHIDYGSFEDATAAATGSDASTTTAATTTAATTTTAGSTETSAPESSTGSTETSAPEVTTAPAA